MEQELKLPAAEAAAAPEAVRPIPWEDPELPRLAAFWRTLWQVLFHPGEFFRDLNREGWAEPLAFGLIVGTAGFLACLYWQLLLNVLLVLLLGEKAGVLKLLTMSNRVTVGLMVLSPALVLAGLGLSSLCLWGGVALMGARASTFVLLLRINSYANGGMALALFPLLGGLVAGLWVLVITYFGVRRVFGLSGGRALLAVAISLALQFLVLLFFLGTLVGLIGLLGLWLF